MSIRCLQISLLNETIDICTNTIYSHHDVMEGTNKEEFRNLSSLATKESYFIFKEVLHKQKDRVAMGSPLFPTLANTFLCFYERKWLEKCLLNLNRFFTDEMLITFLFYSNQPIISKKKLATLILVTQLCPFRLRKKTIEMSILDVEISRENGKFVKTVYHKPNFSGVYIHFESFLPSTHKFGMLYLLVYRYFTLC